MAKSVLLIAALLFCTQAAADSGETLTQLPLATTPLSSSDQLYVVQGGVSKRVPASGLTPLLSLTACSISTPTGSVCVNSSGFIVVEQ